jgi:phosphoglycolate phosphatase
MSTTIGFDLDMTLIDTRPGFRATLAALGAELGVELPLDALSERLGPPLDATLGPYVDAALLPAAIDRFRVLYVDHAIDPVPVLPGAHEALAAVHDRGGRVVLVTGKYAPNAQRHVDHLGLAVDVLHGEVWGVGKADSLRAEGAVAYVGDHVHDVDGARAAGVLSVSVPSGGCGADELRAAGTDVVLPDLAGLAAWLDDRWPGGLATGR